MIKKLKKRLMILLLVSIQVSLYNYVNVHGATNNVQAYNSQNRNVKIKIISATPKKIKIKIFNKGDDIAQYSESFILYKYKKGKWSEIKIISPMPKTLYQIEGRGSKTKTIKCKKIYGKILPKGKYRLKWIQSKRFTIK